MRNRERLDWGIDRTVAIQEYRGVCIEVTCGEVSLDDRVIESSRSSRPLLGVNGGMGKSIETRTLDHDRVIDDLLTRVS